RPGKLRSSMCGSSLDIRRSRPPRCCAAPRRNNQGLAITLIRRSYSRLGLLLRDRGGAFPVGQGMEFGCNRDQGSAETNVPNRVRKVQALRSRTAELIGAIYQWPPPQSAEP